MVNLLGIAAADPVVQGLLMERFLSERRVEMPDVDVDVESARRLEVHRMINGRFGAEQGDAVDAQDYLASFTTHGAASFWPTC